MIPTSIIYLHGFLSSPNSPGALETAAYFREHHPDIKLFLPEIPPDLTVAISIITKLIEQHGPCHFIGISLGGFLATWAAEKFGGKAVLINPVTYPEKIKAQFVGWFENNDTQQRFLVTEKAFGQLQAIEPETISADRYWVFLQTGDEVLDYQLAFERFRACKMTVEQGGCHYFEGYQKWLPQIVQFLEV